MTGQLKFDHATICGPDLELLRQAFSKVGLASDYGGPHANGVTHMALLGFQDGSYLELISPLKNSVSEGSHWGEPMRAGVGACAWAVSVQNIREEMACMNAAGIEVKGPFTGRRKRPDGEVLEWEIAAMGPGEPGALLPFMIEDHTPREWRVQLTAGMQDSGLSGIAAVVLGVKDMRAATALFRQAYGWKAPTVEKQEEFGVEVAHFQDTPVILAAPLAGDSWLTERAQNFGARPAAFLLATGDLPSVAKRFGLAWREQERKTQKWFGRELAWFDSGRLRGVKLGVLS